MTRELLAGQFGPMPHPPDASGDAPPPHPEQCLTPRPIWEQEVIDAENRAEARLLAWLKGEALQ
ncbi:MAG: hypothetical protein JWP35_4646 [Caulobacter sp.]|nr:hypothetical protein [Caulobacter sp.]